MEANLFYATNRRFEGGERLKPKRYGADFSSDGMENLRFGRVNVSTDKNTIESFLTAASDHGHAPGDGEGLAGYLTKRVRESASILAYKESLQAQAADVHQPNAQFGSQSMFEDLRKAMLKSSDVLVYIHGFNVDWEEAVGYSMALEMMLNRGKKEGEKKVLVVLFSWPSNGQALPYTSYKSDRSEAKGSGYAFGRGLLKVRDYLTKLKKGSDELCNQELHLLCHSMGNYVLQNTLSRLREFSSGKQLPRLFSHIFLCAPDVEDDVLEPGKPMEDLHQLTRSVTIYHNTGDVAMYISDYTKGHPDRLGHEGAARPAQLHRKVHQVNCSSIVGGAVEHSYYLWGPVNNDIRFSIDAEPHESDKRKRIKDANYNNVWTMT